MVKEGRRESCMNNVGGVIVDTRTGFIDVEGARLRYQEAGTGEPLVFLHGFSMDLRAWDDQFERFAGRFRTVRYDLRGFGGSSLPRESAAYSHAEDLKVLLDGLGIERAVLIGLSLGGGTAVDFALAHPGMVRAMVLVDSMLGGYRWAEEASNLYRAVIRRAREAGVEAGRRLWLRDPMFETAMSRPEVGMRLAQMVSGYSGWHWLYRDPQTSLRSPAMGRLGEIGAPTLVAVGKLDVPDMQGIASALEAGIPGARKVLLAGAGHLSNMEAAEAFNEVVGEFLAGLPEQDNRIDRIGRIDL